MRWRVDSTAATLREGFGQSLLEDVGFVLRFRRCRRTLVHWRSPSLTERAAIDGHPVFGRFGDQTLYVADCGVERWIIRDRDWWGWPDPPRYVFFAVAGPTIRVAVDFNHWPNRWNTQVDPPGPDARQD